MVFFVYIVYNTNDKELQKSNYGVDYRELVKLYCGKNQIAKLRKIVEFKKHPKYNLSDERLEYLNSMINNRAAELINIIEAKLKENK